jgi:aminopeptidase
MIPGAVALEKLMRKTDKVHIKGPGETDLKFSIKKIGAVKCIGERNIPDGEVYSCPVKDSVEGVIHYNTPTVYQGSSFENVRLEFKKGKIVKATCGSGDVKKLNEIFDSDAGSRYVGEFALGFNPYVKEAICDILFDEKISGSLHFTPGQCYEEASNGNHSQVHWDLVLIQRPEYGGGEIWFDGKLIRKNGLFLPKELQKLNPKALLGK